MVSMYLILSFMPWNDKSRYIETVYGTPSVYGISTLSKDPFHKQEITHCNLTHYHVYIQIESVNILHRQYSQLAPMLSQIEYTFSHTTLAYNEI